MTGPSPDLLQVSDLRVEASDGSYRIVDEVSLSVGRGCALGVVGESGSGKTTVAMALLGFTRPGTRIAKGSVALDGRDLLGLSTAELVKVRGRRISYVPQDPATGLAPNVRVGDLLRQMLTVHGGEREGRLAEILEATQLPTSKDFQRRYPFELSGGQQQRVAIGLALICEPHVVVMDEPTTGLDVTTQSRLIEVIRELVTGTGTSLVYVSHDLGVVRSLANDVAVMYGGRVVEEGPVDQVFGDPIHPYTRGLLEAVPRASTLAYRPRSIPGDAVEPWNWPTGCPFGPRCATHTEVCDHGMPAPSHPAPSRTVRCTNVSSVSTSLLPLEPFARVPTVALHQRDRVLMVEHLNAGFGTKSLFAGKAPSRVVRDVGFEVIRGDCLALVGESGSGKTTTLRCIAGLHVPISGKLEFEGIPLRGDVRLRSSDVRRRIQLVPQNPDSSLNPRHSVGQIIARPIALFSKLPRAERSALVSKLLERVHLSAAMARRFPRELSGGEKQRVAIARALAADPHLLLCDEVVSALDVAVQAGILQLIDELRESANATIVLVTHDLGVVRSVANRVVVMSSGSICESGETQAIFENPRHEYTKELLAAIPHLGPNDYPGAPPA